MYLKKVFSLLLVLSLLLSFAGCGKESPAKNTEPMEEVDETVLRATDLQVNNLDAPLGVDTTPRFSWVNRSTTIGRAQTAYQIIVASTQELAETHTGDLWDTGKVESAECFDIPYAGKELTSRMDCFWAVRVWDEEDTGSEWTEVARFGVGVLDQSEWTAKWIGAPSSAVGRTMVPAPMLRKGFSLAGKVKTAKVFVCGLGLYEMKINGQLPDSSVLNPADTQYEDTVSYNVYDVTQLLQEGKNAVAVELGNGVYNITGAVAVGFEKGVWKDSPKLLLELHVEYEDGSKEVIASDESWRCYEDGPIRSNSIYCGEIYDATMEVEGWTDADFDDSSWPVARLAKEPTGKLKFENMEPMRRVRSVTPTVEKLDEQTWLVRSAEYCTGWARIAFPEARKGQMLEIRYFQRDRERDKGLTLTANDGSGEVYDLQTYTYRAKGDGTDVYEPKFSYAGYELIEITGYFGQMKPEDITCYTVATDVDHIGSFESGNELVNRLHEMMVRTMVCNMQGKPTDTPIFEKLGWTGDYNGAIKTFNYNLDVSSFLSHFLHNLRDTAGDNGQLNEYSPSGWSKSGYNSPAWTQMYINSIYDAWHKNGQFSLIEEHFDYMCKNADYYISKIGGGREPWIWESTEVGDANAMGNRLGDWASPNGSISPTTAPPEGGALYNTAAVYRVLREMAEICTELGETEKAEKYTNAADNIQENFDRYFYNEELGGYETDYWNGSASRTRYRQAMSLVALYNGLTKPENHEKVLSTLVQDIQSKDKHLDVGSVGAELILPVLSIEGYGDLALEILLQTSYPSWGYWVEMGSTSCLEGWKEVVRSYCHYFLGTYDEWFYQNLAGIQNAKNGYETVTIRPEIFPELGYVKASVDTVRGKISSSWKVENNNLSISVKVPIGTTADILLPVAESGNVLLNGEALSLQPGVLEIGTAGDRTLVRVVSGTYNFDLGILQ